MSLFAAELQRRQPWRALAACAGADADLFFEDASGNGAGAQRICGGCPALVDCLVSALVAGEDIGIWGGAGEHTRRSLRTQDRAHSFAAFDQDCTCDYCHAVLEHLDRLAAPIEHRKSGKRVVSFGPGATHGKRSTYKRGCRCDQCREAMGISAVPRPRRALVTSRKRLRLRTSERRERVRELALVGAAKTEIAAALDVGVGTVESDLAALRRAGAEIPHVPMARIAS